MHAHTHTKCQQVQGKTGEANLKMKTENWGRWSGEEDNEKKGGGLKKIAIVPCTLTPWGSSHVAL